MSIKITQVKLQLQFNEIGKNESSKNSLEYKKKHSRHNWKSINEKITTSTFEKTST